ncbi:unnamed protein product, partial [Rotaria sp. Silwood2]
LFVQMWIGGTVSAGVIVFLAFAYAFSSAYYKRYPIEKVVSSPWFGCHHEMINAKFSSSLQVLQHSHLTDDTFLVYEMLDQQPYTLIIDLINTAFTCNDSIVMQRIFSHKLMPVQITSCNSIYNESSISLSFLLPGRAMNLQMTLPGVLTVGIVRIFLKGPGQSKDDGRIILRELDFSSVFAAATTDHVLAPLAEFDIQMTAVINQTAPLSLSAKPIFSTAWSLALNVKLDEIFTFETRYTFYKRAKTIISITLVDTVFFVNNVQQPITRQNEIIFRNLLFTVVVVEVFQLAFLIFKIFLHLVI